MRQSWTDLRILLFLGWLGVARAQDPGLTFHIDSHLALVRFQVSPARGGLVTDLRPSDIRILEDGIPQNVVHFEGGRFYPRSAPVEIALVFDCSKSVQSTGNLNPYVFEDSLLAEYPGAAISIYAFSETLARVTGGTRDTAVLRRALDRVAVHEAGDTALFQSIVDVLRDPGAAKEGTLRMLVVVSDGESTVHGDDRAEEAVVRAARELGVPVFPVLLTATNVLGAMKEQIVSVRKFLDLARATGGEAITTLSTEDLLPRILRAVAARIQFEYVAGYYPQGGSGGAHEVQVVWNGAGRGAILGGSRVVVH